MRKNLAHCTVSMVSAIESLIDMILEGGNQIAIVNGEDQSAEAMVDREAILDALWSTDQDQLVVTTAEGYHLGWFLLVYGNDPNGWDLISDYSSNPYCEAIFGRYGKLFDDDSEFIGEQNIDPRVTNFYESAAACDLTDRPIRVAWGTFPGSKYAPFALRGIGVLRIQDGRLVVDLDRQDHPLTINRDQYGAGISYCIKLNDEPFDIGLDSDDLYFYIGKLDEQAEAPKLKEYALSMTAYINFTIKAESAKAALEKAMDMNHAFFVALDGVTNCEGHLAPETAELLNGEDDDEE